MEEDKSVILFKESFEINFRDYTPNDFDAWTVKKQCDWIKRCEIFSKRATVFTTHYSSSLLSNKSWSTFGKITWMDEYG